MTRLRYILVALCIIVAATPHVVFASKTHVVRKSESLHSIARKYHVSVDELKSVNNLASTRVKGGDRIIIPSHADAKKVTSASKLTTYKARKGDTVASIARKTGVKVAELRRLNDITGNKVKPGQVLALVDTPLADQSARATTASNRFQLINKDLLNEQEFSDTLAELSDINAERPFDLAKSIEENNQGKAINQLRKSAYSFLGARYRFGGSSRNALDCSSFVQQVFREQEVSLPRTAREQFHIGNEVVRGDLKKGDLVFFQTYANFPSHVGIYLGNRKMIHASSRDRRVVISTMDTPYYLSRYLGARRVGKVNTDAFDLSELLVGVEEEQESDVIANDMMGVSLNRNN